jgi:hypothetical protein
MGNAASIYRTLIRAARSFPVRPVGRKIEYNCREVFEVYRGETDTQLIAALEEDAAAALRVIRWCESLPPVRGPGVSTCTAARSTFEHSFLLS